MLRTVTIGNQTFWIGDRALVLALWFSLLDAYDVLDALDILQ